jgi:hypothetical protein
MIDLLSYPDSARVWIYAADRELTNDQAELINKRIEAFCKQWTSHQMALKATGGLLHNFFIVFVVDDGFNKPGGCSIDASVKFIHSLSDEFQTDFFNRNIFYYLQGEAIYSIHKDDMMQALNQGILTDDTLFFDTLVQTKNEFQHNWLKPLKNSWHRKIIHIVNA